jgi:aldose 1-epimerase
LRRGGRIARLRVADLELLVPENQNILGWGCYAMAPWAGRVRDGRFEHAGEIYQLPIRMPPHAIHGTVLDQPWSVVTSSGGSCELEVSLGSDWPWPGIARQQIELTEFGIDCRLEIEATDAPFPASIGWHPWFVRSLSRGDPAELAFEAESVYVVDDQGIPTGEIEPPGKGPWDDCFTGLRADPVLRWDGAIELVLSSTLDHWVVYDRPSHAICVEPWSAPPNSLNGASRQVEPGRPMVGSFGIRWRLLLPSRN